MRKWNEAVSGMDIRKKFFTERVVSLEQGPQGSGHSTKPIRVQEVSG